MARVQLSLLKIAGTILLTLTAATVSWGQITNVTGDQAPPIAAAGHDYIHLLSETVNPAGGAASIRIQVPTPPGRDITVPLAFGYDSNAAFYYTEGALDSSGATGGSGWSYVLPHLYASQEKERQE